MPLVNVSARDYALTIGGLNCTTALKSADGGYAHRDQSGLILISATFVLGRAFGFAENMDDRSNPRWARGQLIKTFIADASGELAIAPILGTLYILNAEYNGINELKIEAGCILSLLSFRSAADDGACVDLGESRNFDYFALRLLQRAGISGFVGSLGGYTLKTSLPKLTNESYIELFGKLCWASGNIAFQNKHGQIQVKSSNPKISPRILSRQLGLNDVRYERLTGAEKPCDVIKVSGVIQELEPTKKDDTTTTIEYGPARMVNPLAGLSTIIVEITKTKEELKFDNRTKITTTTKRQPLGLLMPEQSVFRGRVSLATGEQKVEKSYYEPSTNAKCNEPDEGRITRTEISVYKPYGVAYREYIAAQPTNSISFGLMQLVLESKTVIEYEYVDSDATPLISPTITTTTSQPAAIILPEEKFAVGTSSLFAVERRIQKWRKIREGEWEETEKSYKPLGVARPEVIESLEANNVFLTLNAKLALVPFEDRLVKSNSGGAQPPAPDRFPPIYEIKEKQTSVEVRLPSMFGNPLFREREREFMVDGGLLVSEQQARMIGEIEGAILWGRYKGQSCSVSLEQSMFSATPLDRVDWLDPFNNLSHAFAIDGLTIALAQKRVVMQFDGIWIGTVPTLTPNAPPVPPYLVVFQAKAAMGMEFRVSTSLQPDQGTTVSNIVSVVSSSRLVTVGGDRVVVEQNT
ncbi:MULTISPECIES: hypothetical protein [Cyanophyceae]|uniref:hypothetical protein n=1 Tax=Cyanophyceae TaxID=3028117 RepID=UPI0016849059|nr:hypothetical protein [Trichocoleus sp. FACHB-40]MBD2005607.1 hypothetical protein [Trichocoleus sp. FACHB-40]